MELIGFPCGYRLKALIVYCICILYIVLLKISVYMAYLGMYIEQCNLDSCIRVFIYKWKIQLSAHKGFIGFILVTHLITDLLCVLRLLMHLYQIHQLVSEIGSIALTSVASYGLSVCGKREVLHWWRCDISQWFL